MRITVPSALRCDVLPVRGVPWSTCVRVRCSGEESFVEKLQERLAREMLQHVDVEPKRPPPDAYEAATPEQAQIRKAERFALDGWSSSTFQATGVIAAFLLAVAMILNSPVPHT